MAVIIKNFNVSEWDLYMYVDVEEDGNEGSFCYNLMWRDVSHVVGISVETEIKIKDYIEEELLPMLEEHIADAAFAMNRELTGIKAELEVQR